MSSILIRSLRKDDLNWLRQVIEKEWSSIRVVSRGKVHYVDQLTGFVTVQERKRVGLLTFKIDDQDCEIITLNILKENIGIGSKLIAKIEEYTSSIGCKRIWLVTTNDNLNAIRFYQKKGYSLSALYRNAAEDLRRLKPEIPLIGMDGIPIRDEIELEKIL
ncbi:MAG: GNAT family N-acetyltransferase [Candidatus Hodarchaeota archaeon]